MEQSGAKLAYAVLSIKTRFEYPAMEEINVMDLDPSEHTDNIFETSSMVSSLVLGGLVAAATIATRKGAEHSWAAVFNRPPPNKQPEDQADLKDAMLWAAVIGATTGLVRLGVRRSLRKKAKHL